MSRSQEISKWFRNLQHSKKLSWISYVVLGAVLFFALMNNVKPEQLDVNMYSIAKKTIHSPIKIEDKDRGNGLEIMKQITNKYNGETITTVENDVFETLVTMKCTN